LDSALTKASKRFSNAYTSISDAYKLDLDA
jgi:hypothetical protein